MQLYSVISYIDERGVVIGVGNGGWETISRFIWGPVFLKLVMVGFVIGGEGRAGHQKIFTKYTKNKRIKTLQKIKMKNKNKI